MKYGKPPLSFEEQADRMIQRGLIADRSLLVTSGIELKLNLSFTAGDIGRTTVSGPLGFMPKVDSLVVSAVKTMWKCVFIKQ
jgi:hypothetical protein